MAAPPPPPFYTRQRAAVANERSHCTTRMIAIYASDRIVVLCRRYFTVHMLFNSTIISGHDMPIFLQTHTHRHAHTHACMYTHTHTCARMHACTCAHTHTHTHYMFPFYVFLANSHVNIMLMQCSPQAI